MKINVKGHQGCSVYVMHVSSVVCVCVCGCSRRACFVFLVSSQFCVVFQKKANFLNSFIPFQQNCISLDVVFRSCARSPSVLSFVHFTTNVFALTGSPPDVLEIAMERLSRIVAKIRRLDWGDLNETTLREVML